MNKYMDFKIGAAYENNLTNRNSQSAEGIMSSLYSNRGRENLWLPDSDINYDKMPYANDLHQNPIRTMKYAGSNVENRHFIDASGNLQVKNLLKGLTIDFRASRRLGMYSQEIDRIFIDGQGRNGPLTTGNVESNTSVQKVKNNSIQDKLEALVNYRLKFDRHSFAFLGGASYEHFLRDQIDARANVLMSDELFSFKYYDSGDAANSILTDAVNEWKMASLFGRINYDYNNRYLLEFVARYDGSSRLASGNRFGFFPGVSAGWVISEESFFAGITDYVNFLKLRGSYGQVGNSTVLNSMYYPYIGTIYRGDRWMGERVYYRRDMTSADVKWETVTNTNIAVDMSFLKSRLYLTAEYFWKKNKDMLSRMAPGNLVGVEQLPYENVGTMKTWGWELSARWRDRIGDLRYNVAFIIDDAHNELIDYKGTNTIAPGNVRLLEGYSINTLWGYETDGFFTSRADYEAFKTANPGWKTWQDDTKMTGGDVKYLGQGKQDHEIGVGGGTPDEPGDLIYLGDANPHFSFGINIGAQWKGFDFSCFFQGVAKRSFFLQNSVLMPLSGSGTMPWTVHRDYWREDNQNAYFASLWENSALNSGGGNYQYADRWIQNGAYIRLKTIQLGYTVPIKKYVQSLRIYVSGNDLWEHTKILKAFDPEYINNLDTRTGTSNVNDRVSRNYYPFMRTWTAGVNVSF